jgi:rhodanese-related sulfurtransferase
MSVAQIIIYALLLFLILNVARKKLNSRKLTHYTSEEAKLKLKEGTSLFLDVRTDAERKAGSIKGSIHIPLNQLPSRIEELKKFRDKEVICYCRSGNRSVTAALILQKNGINGANLKNGYIAWS